jgi:hypothetical protein
MIIVHDSEIKRTPSVFGVWLGTLIAFSSLPAAIIRILMSQDKGDVVLLVFGVFFTFIGYKFCLKFAINPPLYFAANGSGISFDTGKGRHNIPWQHVLGLSEGEIDRTPMSKNSLRGHPVYLPAVRIDLDDSVDIQGRTWGHDMNVQKNTTSESRLRRS